MKCVICDVTDVRLIFVLSQRSMPYCNSCSVHPLITAFQAVGRGRTSRELHIFT